MKGKSKKPFRAIVLCMAIINCVFGVDNSSLYAKGFPKHYKTYGVVYLVDRDISDRLMSYAGGVLREKILKYGITDAPNRTNLPHITVLHIHTQDSTTPQKMLSILLQNKLPKPFSLNLKGFGFVKASKDSAFPWWFDINVEHTLGYDEIMEFNELATTLIAPLRDSPLPRVSGSIYASSSKEAKGQIEDFGVNGVNRTINGERQWLHRPHITLSYSMQNLNPKLEAELKTLADELNKDFDKGLKATFDSVSIVEIGVSGNVLREIYRINLQNKQYKDIAKSLQE